MCVCCHALIVDQIVADLAESWILRHGDVVRLLHDLTEWRFVNDAPGR